MKRIIGICMAVMMVAACQESLEERCLREAKTYTEKHCPIPVSKDIVMDSMTFDKATHTISYAYTLSGALDDSAVIHGSNSRDLLLQEVKNSTHLKLYKEAGYNFRYIYHSKQKKGTKLLEATFRKSDYQ